MLLSRAAGVSPAAPAILSSPEYSPSLPQAPQAAPGMHASPAGMCASPVEAVGTVQSWQGTDRRGHKLWSALALLPSCFSAGSWQRGLDPTIGAKRHLVLQKIYWLYSGFILLPSWARETLPWHSPMCGANPLPIALHGGSPTVSLPMSGVTGSGFCQKTPCPPSKPIPRPDHSPLGCGWIQGRNQQQDGCSACVTAGEGRAGSGGICPAVLQDELL